MRNIWILLLLLTAIAIGVPQNATAQEEQSPAQENTSTEATPTATADDAAISGEISRRFAHDEALSNLDVKVENGTVHLYGTLPTKAEIKRTTESVREMKGVRDVQSHLTVGQALMNPSATTPLNPPMEEDPQRPQPTDTNMNNSDSTATPQNEDRSNENGSLVDKVESKINADTTLANHQIQILADQEGIVTVSGTVASSMDQQRLLELVRSVPGVTEVKSEITVEQE